MNKPNMIPEIIEAIHLMYEDTPYLEADCYLCLTSLCYPNGVANEAMTRLMARAGRNYLEDMGRCTKCGTVLEHYKYTEIHNEVDFNKEENMIEEYCPNCDMKGI